MSSVGQCKVDPPTGVAGDVFANWTGDGDASLLAAALTSGSTVRKLLGAQIEALVKALLGRVPIGTANIAKGADHVDVTDSACQVGSLVLAIVVGGTADATCTHVIRTKVNGAGAFTIWGNAAVTDVAGVDVGYAILT